MLGKFKKSERLCSRKSIGRLFSTGNSIFHYPFRLVWHESDTRQPFPVRFAVSVPGRKIKKAVIRNQLKRLIKESYRLNKGILYESLILQDRKIDMMLIYISVNVYDYALIDLKIREVIRKLITRNEPDKEIL